MLFRRNTVTPPSVPCYYGLGVDEFMEAKESAISFIRGEYAELETDDGLTSDYETGTKMVSFTKESYYACQDIFSTVRVVKKKEVSVKSGDRRSRIYRKEL